MSRFFNTEELYAFIEKLQDMGFHYDYWYEPYYDDLGDVIIEYDSWVVIYEE